MRKTEPFPEAFRRIYRRPGRRLSAHHPFRAPRSPLEIFTHHLACLVLSLANTNIPYLWDTWSFAVIVEFNSEGCGAVGPGAAHHAVARAGRERSAASPSARLLGTPRAAVFLVGQRVVPKGWAQYLMRVLCLVTWIPCRATPIAAFLWYSQKCYLDSLAPVWATAFCFLMTLYLAWLQVVWTSRLISSTMISDVVDATFGTTWGEKRRKDGGADGAVNEGL